MGGSGTLPYWADTTGAVIEDDPIWTAHGQMVYFEEMPATVFSGRVIDGPGNQSPINNKVLG